MKFNMAALLGVIFAALLVSGCSGSNAGFTGPTTQAHTTQRQDSLGGGPGAPQQIQVRPATPAP